MDTIEGKVDTAKELFLFPALPSSPPTDEPANQHEGRSYGDFAPVSEECVCDYLEKFFHHCPSVACYSFRSTGHFKKSKMIESFSFFYSQTANSTLRGQVKVAGTPIERRKIERRSVMLNAQCWFLQTAYHVG